MAESPDNAAESAEDANAASAVAATPVKDEVAEVAKAKPARKKPVAAKSRTISKPRRRRASAPAARADSAPRFTAIELKDKIMATAKTTDFTKPFAEAIGDVQNNANAAYDKGAELAAEATEFAKGNAEAVVESTRIYAAGVQDLGKIYAEEAKSAFATLNADAKELAAVKSPAELFQLQAKLARRNFDALVAYGSKNTEAVTKLASEAFAPISGRVSLAAEKIAKAA
jgi:phasin family protein